MRRINSLLFFVMFFASYAFAGDVYNERLEKGLTNTEPYSHFIITNAAGDPAGKKEAIKEALRYSPDFPPLYFELARSSMPHVFEALDYLVQGIKAYKRNFWWSQGLKGLLLYSAVLSFLVSSALFVLVRLHRTLSFLSHDITHDKMKLLLTFCIIATAFLGPVFFIAGVLIITGIYLNKYSKAFVYVYLAAILITPYLLNNLNSLLYSSNPKLRAVVYVNENRDNTLAISVLNGVQGFPYEFSYALALKRNGSFDTAIETYQKMLENNKDPRSFTNLGNAFFGRGLISSRGTADIETSKEAYKKSIEQNPSVRAFYNISKASMETLDYKSGDEYSAKGMALSRDEVARFSSIAERTPNRFVMDETLSLNELRDTADSAEGRLINLYPVSSVFVSGIALILIVIFAVLDLKIKYRAVICTRCGKIFCGKCSKKATHGSICQDCHEAMTNPSAESPQKKVERILATQGAKTMERRILMAIAFTLPGLSHIFSGKALSGFAFLWLFIFSITVIVFNPLVSTGLSGYSHSWLTLPCAVLAGLIYFISALLMVRRIKKGWL